MAQKFVHKHKTSESQKQRGKQKAIGRVFELYQPDDEFDDENEGELEEIKENEFENSPIEIYDEDSIEQKLSSDFRWTSEVLDDMAVKKKKVVIVFIKTHDGVRAAATNYKSKNENSKVLFEIVDNVNKSGFSSFHEMEGQFKSNDFGNNDISRKVITNNYGMLEPYGRIVKLNFLTSKGRRAEKIDTKKLKKAMKEIFDDGYTKKGKVADLLVERYSYSRSVQRRKEFQKVYEEVKNCEGKR